MHKVLPYASPPGGGITSKNLLRKIWTEPSATLSYILATCPDEHVAMLFVLGGIARAVGRAASHPASKTNAAGLLLLAVVGGSISGIMTYTIYAWGLSLTGRWLGGKASTAQFKTVLGWALVPLISSLALLIPTLAVLGGEAPMLPISLPPSALVIGCGVLQLVLSTWSVTILLQGITLIQPFGIGKALLNMLLPGGLVIGAFLAFTALW